MGIRPVNIIKNAGSDASIISSSWANWYVYVARVSKLKGLNIKVIGNSFTISTKVKIAAAITDALTIGKVILNDVEIEEYPKLFDASKRFKGILEYPEVTPP